MKGWWKFMHWLVFRLRIYVAWSWIYNQFRNRGYRKAWRNWIEHCTIKKVAGEIDHRGWRARTLQQLNLADIQANLNEIKWKRDSWRAFWDAIAWPERMLFWISCKTYAPTKKTDPRHALWKKKGMKQPETEMDCDDFTSAALWMIDHMNHADLDEKGVTMRGWFLNVARLEGKSFWGHNVCLVEDTKVGPKGDKTTEWWHIGNWGDVGPKPNVPDIIKTIRDDLPLVGWAVLTHERKLIDRDGKMPPEGFLRP